MASLAKAAFGTLLKIGDGGGGGEVFTTISELTNIGFDGPTVNTIDVSNHDSPSAYQEFIAGMIDGGTLSFSGNYISSTTQDQTRTDMVARTMRNFKVVYPLASPETHSFAALITTFHIADAAVDGKISCEGSLKISGAITVT